MFTPVSSPRRPEARRVARIVAVALGSCLSACAANTRYMFAQTTVVASGETIAFSEFVRLDLMEHGGEVSGGGSLGSGERIELRGTQNGGRLEAAVANVTSAINVELVAIAAESQITGRFAGAGAGQEITGTFVLLR